MSDLAYELVEWSRWIHELCAEQCIAHGDVWTLADLRKAVVERMRAQDYIARESADARAQLIQVTRERDALQVRLAEARRERDDAQQTIDAMKDVRPEDVVNVVAENDRLLAAFSFALVDRLLVRGGQ